jgi:biotin carboxylase
VLLIGGVDEVVRKAGKLGLRVLMLQHPAKVTDEQRRLGDGLHVLDYTDWAAVRPLVTRLHERPGFAAAVSLTEAGQEVAGRVSDLLGLGGTGYEVAHRVRDKWAMRQHLTGQHLAGRDPAAVGAAPLRDRGDLAAFAARYGYPLIVKPSNATASFGIFRVGGPADADAAWAGVQRLRGTRTDRGSLPFLIEDFLIEEYIDGPEYSVESFSFAGRHVVVAITEKFTDPVTFTELGHAVPARLAAAPAAAVRAAVIRFLDAMGVRDGTGHTEVRIGPRGPAVIEGHTRIAGDNIADLVLGAYGIDLISYAVGWPFGLVPELPDEPPPRGGACGRFLVGSPGKVASVTGVCEARAQDGVLLVQVGVAPGDTVRAPRDNWDRIGLVAAAGADTGAAISRAGQVARDCIRIEITAPDGTSRLARLADAADAGEPAAGDMAAG